MIDLIPGELLVGLGGLLAAAVAFFFGKSKGKTQAKLEGYSETRKRMDKAPNASDAGAAREWLRKRK